jgi:hypothetical protein
LLEALEVLHREGMVHGDLSPANLRVSDAGTLKVLDVGYGAPGGAGDADPEASEPVPASGPGLASPLHAAPERFEGGGPGPAADVFSFGKILYRMLAGERPFSVKPVSLKAGAPAAAWDAFVFRCVEERPGDRFADAGAARAEFRRVRAGSRENADTMIPAAWVTLAGYVFFRVPGALLNAAYLGRARKIRRETGLVPLGAGALRVMQALFFWMPLGLLAAVFALVLAVRMG